MASTDEIKRNVFRLEEAGATADEIEEYVQSAVPPAPIPSTPEARQAAVQQRVQEMTARDEALQAQQKLAEIEARRIDRMRRWGTASAPDERVPLARMSMLVKEAIPMAKDFLAQAGIVGGSAAVGQTAGKAAGRPGRAVGGAVGAAAGSIAEQAIKVYSGEQPEINAGRVLADAIGGATTTRRASGNATANMAAETVRSLIDERELPSKEQLGLAASMGVAGALASKRMTGKALRPEDAFFQYRNDSFRALRGEGVVVNPQLLSRGGKILPTIAGESTLNAATSRHNQPIYNALVREELGLSKKPLPLRPRQNPDPSMGKKLIPGELDEVIKEASEPYVKIREISEGIEKQIEDFKAGRAKSHPLINRTPQEAQALLSTNKNLDALKQARDSMNDARARMKAGDPEAYQAFVAAKQAEDALEAQIQQAADIAGSPKLVEELKAGRVRLAQAFAVREAVDSFGIVDINEFARMRATESRPGRMLTGRLKQLADFAEAFSPSAQDSVAVAIERPSGVALNYSARQAALGRPSGLLSAGVPVMSEQVKEFLLGRRMQNRFAQPMSVLNPETMAPSAAREFLMATGRGDDVRVPFLPPEEQ